MWLAGVLLSVTLTFFSFPPYPLGGIMFVGLVPLFLAIETAPSTRQAFFRAWLYVFLGNSAICFWVAHTMNHFAKLPWILSYPSVALLSVFEQSAWPVMAALRHLLHKRYQMRPLLWTPLCLMAIDFAWPKFFPNTMGNVFYSVPWIAQFADVTGVWGLTALLVASNEAVAVLILRQWPKAELRKHALVTAGVFSLALGYSIWRYQSVRALKPERTIPIAVVQPNVNAVAKVREESDKNWARLKWLSPVLRLSEEIAKEKPALIFWPETAVSNSYHSDSWNETLTVTQAIDQFVGSTRVPLLFGARHNRDTVLHNSIYLLTPTETALPSVQRYDKHLLLWLGEYIPFSTWLPSLTEVVRNSGGTVFTPGSGPMVILFNDLKLGPMICLEGLYASYVRRIALLDVDLFVNATNDAWFGPGMEPALHLYLTTFRSIETRRPMVRSTTTGFSALVDIDGQLLWKSEMDKEEAKVLQVPIYPRMNTPYLWWGHTLIWLAALYAAFPFAKLWWRARR